VRPEPFGALVYHYGNRKLVFLKSPRMVALVRSLGAQPSVDDALDAARIPASARNRYLAALQSLLESDMIVVGPRTFVDSSADSSVTVVSTLPEGPSHGTAR
jgi:putative mycofactocin binding protein MftB